MNIINDFLLSYAFLYNGIDTVRHLQMLPNYTSPPTELAILATPEAFQDDAVIEAGREADKNGECENLGVEVCQILFEPATSDTKIGVIYYGGALVDPRSYSVFAKKINERYGFAVSVPIFDGDVAFKGCQGTNRTDLASKAFPSVEKWILAGHSLGGIGASIDLSLALQNNETAYTGGLALYGSYVNQNVCPGVDFSVYTDLPVASVSGSVDLILNATNFEASQKFLPEDNTFHMDILGGNHAQFGSYDDSERFAILNQTDGKATISEDVQLDLSSSALAHVASRTGLPFPEVEEKSHVTSSASWKCSRNYAALIIVSSICVLYLI